MEAAVKVWGAKEADRTALSSTRSLTDRPFGGVGSACLIAGCSFKEKWDAAVKRMLQSGWPHPPPCLEHYRLCCVSSSGSQTFFSEPTWIKPSNVKPDCMITEIRNYKGAALHLLFLRFLRSLLTTFRCFLMHSLGYVGASACVCTMRLPRSASLAFVYPF